jgi:hypothetical protein
MAAFDTTELEQDLDATADNVLKQLLHDSERDDDVCLLMCHMVTPPEAAGEPGAAGS